MEQEFLKNFIDRTMEHLGSNLVGIYLHGSMAMNGYVPGRSDVDLLIVVHHDWLDDDKRLLVEEYMELEDRFVSVKIEMSVVLKRSIENFSHPSPFVLHYSSEHKERYISDSKYICGNSVDPDLAAHYMVTYERGICLYGPPVRTMFRPIPGEAYLNSILYDVQDAEVGILRKPDYYILNLCRVLYYMEEGIVSSKLEAGEWALGRLTDDRELIESALLMYAGLESPTLKRDVLQQFTRKMLEMIYSFR